MTNILTQTVTVFQARLFDGFKLTLQSFVYIILNSRIDIFDKIGVRNLVSIESIFFVVNFDSIGSLV